MGITTVPLLDTLQRIHLAVFSDFEYETDLKNYKTKEHWETIPASFTVSTQLNSDCKDFAMACRKICIDVITETTRLVLCNNETGAGHCVLECEGYVLDNRFDKVVTKKFLENTGYKWIAISGSIPGDPWYKLPSHS